MENVLIIIHLMIVVALVIVVLLQRSEGGALGIGGGGGGLMSARGAANALTRTTAILAVGFFVTSLSLGILARYGSQPTDILDTLPATTQGEGGGEGSLLDQLGGLPEDEGQQAPASDATGGAASGTASDSLIDGSTQPTAPAPAQNEAAPAEPDAVEQIPANPAGDTPQGADEATVPPVEPPPAGTERPADVAAPDEAAAPASAGETAAPAATDPAPANEATPEAAQPAETAPESAAQPENIDATTDAPAATAPAATDETTTAPQAPADTTSDSVPESNGTAGSTTTQ